MEDYEKEFGAKPSLPSSTSMGSAPATPKAKKGLLQEGGTVQNFGVGLAKGALQTAQGLGQLGLKGVKALTGKDYGTKETFLKDPNALKAQGTAEKLGKFTEQVAEFAVPGSKVGKLTQGTNILTKTASRAATSGAVATAQQGEIGKDTALAAGTEAAIPIAGAVIKPAVKFLGNLLKGTSSGLSGAPSEAIEQIYKNPKVALQTAKEIRDTGGSTVLRKNAEKIVNGVSTIKQQARSAYGQGLEQLSQVQIEAPLIVM